MDGEIDGEGSQAQVAGEQEPQGNQEAAPAQVGAGGEREAGADGDGAGADYARLLAERDEQRVAFELTMAGAKSVKAARALLADHDGDIDKLRAAEPWLFGAVVAAPSGATGLEPAGAAGGGEGAELSRWKRIAGLEDK